MAVHLYVPLHYTKTTNKQKNGKFNHHHRITVNNLGNRFNRCKEMKKPENLKWRVNTPQLLKEIGNNNDQMAGIGKPLMIFARILAEVATRASQLNDDKLNELMCRLALYEVSDPYSKDYNKKITDELLEKGQKSD